MAVHRDDSERFRRLSILGRIGWWEADFSSRQYLCSEYVCKLLGLEGEYLSFEDFGKMIREDYRARISREFLAIQNMEVYEQTFPIYSTEGVVWVYSRVGYKEYLPDGTLKAFGVLQRVEMPKEEAAKQALQRERFALSADLNIPFPIPLPERRGYKRGHLRHIERYS